MSSAATLSIFLIIASLLRSFETHNTWLIVTLLGVCFSVAFYVVYPKEERKARQKQITVLYQKEIPGSTGQFTMELLNKHLRISGARGDETFSYAYLKEITQSEGYVYLKRPLLAHPIPKAKIIEGDLEQFVRELQIRMAAVPPFPTELPITDVSKKFWSSRRALTASAACIVAAALGYFLITCGCSYWKVGVWASVASGVLGLGLLDFGYGLWRQEKAERAKETCKNSEQG